MAKRTVKLAAVDRFGDEIHFEVRRPSMKDLRILEALGEMNEPSVENMEGVLTLFESIDGGPPDEAPLDMLPQVIEATMAYLSGKEPLPSKPSGTVTSLPQPTETHQPDSTEA